MQTTHSTVPGTGVLHDCHTRDGQQFRILVARPGQYELFVYDSAEPDRAVARIVLEEDEADHVAELERRVDQLAGNAMPLADPRVPSLHTRASAGSCDSAGPAD
jgi:TrkA domain protein